METIVFLTFLRLTIPLLILRWPIFGILASMFLDLADYTQFTITSETQMNSYQVWDKTMDTYYLSLALLTTLSWKEMIAKKISIILYFYRVVGVILLLITQVRSILVLFPNAFENFFLFYLIFRRFTKHAALFRNNLILAFILVILIVPKVLAEYYMHALQSPHILTFLDFIRSTYVSRIEGITLYTLHLLPAVVILIGMILWIKNRPTNYA